jgi:hypothetical protein
MSAKLPIMEQIHDQNDPVIPNPGQPEVPDPQVPELAPEPQQPEIQEPPPAPVEVPQPGIERP